MFQFREVPQYVYGKDQDEIPFYYRNDQSSAYHNHSNFLSTSTIYCSMPGTPCLKVFTYDQLVDQCFTLGNTLDNRAVNWDSQVQAGLASLSPLQSTRETRQNTLKMAMKSDPTW